MGKREKEDFLSACVESVRSLIQIRIKKKNLNGLMMSTRKTSLFKDQNDAKRLSHLHDNDVVVPAGKASNNIVFVSKYIT